MLLSFEANILVFKSSFTPALLCSLPVGYWFLFYGQDLLFPSCLPLRKLHYTRWFDYYLPVFSLFLQRLCLLILILKLHVNHSDFQCSSPSFLHILTNYSPVFLIHPFTTLSLPTQIDSLHTLTNYVTQDDKRYPQAHPQPQQTLIRSLRRGSLS